MWRLWATMALGATALAQARTLHPSSNPLSAHLMRRADPSCPDNFQTISGLDFDMHCSQNQPGWDLVPRDGGAPITTQEDSMADCMKRCATQRPLCFGVAYDYVDGTCWFKNETYTYQSAFASTSNNTHLAVARKSELQGYSQTCQYRNGSTQTDNGLPFTIHCKQDIVGADYVPWASPALNGLFHATSLGNCMDICTKAQDLCEGVAYNPGMENGYGNCYPKNSGGNGFGFRPTGNSSGVDGGPIIHSAVAHLPVINSSCDDGKVVATDNGTGYTLSCSQNRPGNDLTQYHTTNLTDCITTCEQYSLGKCIGVVLDTNMKNGYQNCYLKSGIGTPMTQQGYILALQGGTVTSSNSTNTTSPTSTPSNSGSGGSSSKGWIAGPVVGGVAAIALLGAAIWFFRRRKQRSATAGAVEKDGQSVPSSSTGHGQPPAYGSGADPKYRYSSPGTPGGAGWEGAPASTPMAEMGGQDRHEMPTQKDQQPVELPAQSHNVL